MAERSNQKLSVADRFRAAFAQEPGLPVDAEEEGKHRGLVISLCIIVAAVLWFAFSMQETYIQIIDLPTEVYNLPPGEALTVRPPETVRVRVEGEGVQLLRLYYNQPPVRVDASETTIDLMMAANDLTSYVSLISVAPASIELTKEERIEKRIPVVSNLAVRLEPGHRIIGSVEVIPDSVTVRGGRSIVEGVSSWPTVSRRLTGVEDSIRTVLALSDTLRGLVQLDVQEVEVLADVQEFTTGRRVVEVRITDAPVGKKVALDPPRVTVEYQIPLSQYDRALDAEAFYATVPYEEIRDDTSGLVYPMLNIPEGLEVRESRLTPAGLRYYDVLDND